MILNVRLWEKDVAAISWNVDREYATVEFFESFAGKQHIAQIGQTLRIRLSN